MIDVITFGNKFNDLEMGMNFIPGLSRRSYSTFPKTKQPLNQCFNLQLQKFDAVKSWTQTVHKNNWAHSLTGMGPFSV